MFSIIANMTELLKRVPRSVVASNVRFGCSLGNSQREEGNRWVLSSMQTHDWTMSLKGIPQSITSEAFSLNERHYSSLDCFLYVKMEAFRESYIRGVAVFAQVPHNQEDHEGTSSSVQYLESEYRLLRPQSQHSKERHFVILWHTDLRW